MRSPIPFAVLGLLTAGLLLPPAMVAQSGIHVGPMAGVSFAKFHGDDVGDGQKTRTGFVGGGFAELGLSENFAVELQALYVQKGAKADAEGIEGTFALDYIQLPLLLKALYVMEGTTRIAPNVFVGPAVGIKTRCKVKASGGGSTQDETCDNLGLDIRSTDFSVVFGAGIDLGPIALQGRYDLGLRNVQDVSPELDVKTSAWIFTAGLRLPTGQ